MILSDALILPVTKLQTHNTASDDFRVNNQIKLVKCLLKLSDFCY